MSRLAIPSACQTTERGSVIAREEHYCRVELHNPQHLPVAVVSVDGCMKLPNQPQADYLFQWQTGQGKKQELTELFVELKGSDIHQGEKQMRATLARFQPAGARVTCVIVYRRNGLPNKDALTRLKRKFLETTGYFLRVEKSTYRHDVP